ncbi:hypothetical protein FS935_21280 [Metabacillus litoralis]|uniref:SGNH/GDSL hydrolase family protein n=1 Tax=Metabacillus litoralis TaxID=152268 RepID=A0A5C6VBA1_9BACI|nr:SGNH/GDSL hydrolase family protein [Metabacillus litoralis]TXC82230.1 hypothetical protein FS935_21280 [Metabacillus litoralis]
MKRFIYTIVLLVCVGSIVAGNIHWNNKLSAQAEMLREPVKTNTVEEKNTEEALSKEEVEKVAKPEEKPETSLSTYTKNLPKTLQDKIIASSKSGKPLQFVIYGSESTPDEKGTWPELFKKKLVDTYGEDIFNVTVISEGHKTSIDVNRANSYEKVSEVKPDIVLFEPFTISDNTKKIAMKNRFDSIRKMIGSWKVVNPEVTIFLQPGNPLYGATYYPKQIDDLKVFAEEQNIAYLNHWEKWPVAKDEKLKNYLTAESLPNDRGHKVWVEYLSQYFTGN